MNIGSQLFTFFVLVVTTLPTAQAASIFRIERWYEQPVFPDSGYDRTYDAAQGIEFRVFPNTPYSGLEISLRNPLDIPLLSKHVRIEFEIGRPIPPGPSRYESVTHGPGSPPWMWYSHDTGVVTNYEGEFEILELEYAIDGSVDRLAIDFFLSSPSINVRQYDRGRLRYNSSIPVPEPGTVWLSSMLVIAMLDRVCYRRPVRLT